MLDAGSAFSAWWFGNGPEQPALGIVRGADRVRPGLRQVRNPLVAPGFFRPSASASSPLEHRGPGDQKHKYADHHRDRNHGNSLLVGVTRSSCYQPIWYGPKALIWLSVR